MSSHNKPADVQRKVEYFRQLRNQTFRVKKPPQFNLPKFVTTPRRPGMRGK
jgi:hypothetical protein